MVCWKHLFLFRGFLIIKTTFSYFPGMFVNSAPAVKTSCKLNIIKKKSIIKWNINFIRIIDDYRLYYLNDLFGIKLIFLTIRIVYWNFLNLYGRYVWSVFFDVSLSTYSALYSTWCTGSDHARFRVSCQTVTEPKTIIYSRNSFWNETI